MSPVQGINAKLNFFDPLRPVETFVTVNGRELPLDEREVVIQNARELEEMLPLDRCGFSVIEHQTRATNLCDPEQQETIYKDEVAGLIRRLTGADKVIAFYMMVRYNDPRITGEVRRPAALAHLDFDGETVALYAREQLELAGEDADFWMAQRYAAYNVWRGIVPVREMPLAVCDGRTVRQEDLHPVRTEMEAGVATPYRGMILEHNPSQRWYYYKDMNPDEVLVFKQFDTEPYEVRCNPHTAFDDHGPVPQQRRVSLEARAFAFFKRPSGLPRISSQMGRR